MQSSTRQTVLVTGGTGFVGRYIVRKLLTLGQPVRLLGRSGIETEALPPGVEYVPRDLSRGDDLGSALDGCNTVIHLVGVIEEDRRRGVTFESAHTESTRNMVNAAEGAGVSSFIHMSANGARPDGVSRYQTTKWEAEEIVRKAGFDSWTIFRPSIIFGRPRAGRPEFTTRLVDTLLKPLPIWPVFGDGKYRLQPIAVEDVARAFGQAVSDASHRNRTYCLAGPESFTYLEILVILADAADLKSRPRMHQPVWLARRAIRMAGPLGLLPITPDQLEMLLDGNICEDAHYKRDFGTAPTPFNRETLRYLRLRG
ncbi:MAG: complex I NDUFA9 subunit family protein [Bacteroidetes bacterium]|nr:complex I NDUFA9 subunit family protein [Bacteroidota bacterium]